MKANINELKNIINNFKKISVLIIGDIIFDEYIWGEVNRISPEAPVPVVNVKKITYALGGAANVAKNISELANKVYLCGIIGDDEYGERIKKIIKENNIISDYIIIDNSRPTIRKTRVLAQSQQVVRIDNEKIEAINLDIEKQIINYTHKILPDINVVILSDYAKGLLTSSLIKKIIFIAKKNNKILVVDPKVENFNYFKQADIMTPNKSEASRGIGITIKNDVSLYKAGKTILKKLKLNALLITRSEEGMSLFYNNKIYNIPTEAQEVYDVTGAGDTVSAILSLALGTGADYLNSAIISNCAAGIVVKEIGCASVTKKQLLEKIKSVSEYSIVPF
ncbi:MAG TPA: D-glycero-beta-D-manno-heptose-7-phosphate kinase [bacterium]|nr:D-glycero-beta-D-manno-heptose-7-phosphate kinase [bacterium]HOL47962.1 D-glycero-beta-D-manno-heptose-7-phosphate kinase [bacterium]HPQ18050.1 D-glycero-beta-D-manno-heptose-7-phosphate kinase [bacterium]